MIILATPLRRRGRVATKHDRPGDAMTAKRPHRGTYRAGVTTITPMGEDVAEGRDVHGWSAVGAARGGQPSGWPRGPAGPGRRPAERGGARAGHAVAARRRHRASRGAADERPGPGPVAGAGGTRDAGDRRPRRLAAARTGRRAAGPLGGRRVAGQPAPASGVLAEQDHAAGAGPGPD